MKVATYRKKRYPYWDSQFHSYEVPHRKTNMKLDTITDSQGLRRAYRNGDYYVHGQTLFIAGSHTAKDWFDDFTKIPVWGDLKDSTRYKKALEAIQENPSITTVIGHSLGGSVALELEKNYPQIKHSRTYGAPVFDLLGKDDSASRYRNWVDPVSIFDRSAQKSIKWNPFESFSLTHDFSNIADKTQSTDLINVKDA